MALRRHWRARLGAGVWNTWCRQSARSRIPVQHRLSSSSSTGSKKVILSGIQPTGTPHIGNYVGAVSQWVKLQDEPAEQSTLLYSVVDLHAITSPTPARPETLRAWRRESFAALLAAGIDPKRSILFFQSSVAAHSELMWILSCRASMGYLSRMTQWKAKLALSPSATVLDDKAKSALKLGLFSYPVLQAADILVYRATHVPVGDDQRQHVEFARECVINFNSAYGQHLVCPETVSSPDRRIMSLQDPTQKMSKSHRSEKSRILITDRPEEIHKKIMGAVTDPSNTVSYDPATRPGVANLLQLLSFLDDKGTSPQHLAASLASQGAGLGQLKQLVSEKAIAHLASIRERYIDLLAEDDGRYVDSVAADGARRARILAEETMDIIRRAIGL